VIDKLHFRKIGEKGLQRGIKKGNHGREIRSITLRTSNTGELLLATGSEDTYINFTTGKSPITLLI
jgi:hypothetical protein